jgi:uncharacterized protein
MTHGILDTGPIVAWFCPRDEHHAWARRAFLDLAPGSLVCEAVLAEASYLVAKEGVPKSKVIEFVQRGRLQPVSSISELSAISKLLDHYADARMDYADACIVRLAEIHNHLKVFTVDHDFLFFKKANGQAIPLIAPFA